MSALLDLRTELTAVLATELGVYVLANGFPTPAVRCSGPDETRHPGTIVQGLELVIIKDPRLIPIRQYQNERVQLEWTAFLVAWGDRPSAIAAQKVADAFPGCEIERVEVPEGIGPADQYRLTIRSLSTVPVDALVPVGQGRNNIVTLSGAPLVTLDGRQLVARVAAESTTVVISGDFL